MDFEIVKELSTPIEIATLFETKHYSNDRIARKELINHLGGIGIGLYSWLVIDNKNRQQTHTLTNNGMIVISNLKNEIVTILIARPNQIRRYFEELPKGLERMVEEAMKRKKFNFNDF